MAQSKIQQLGAKQYDPTLFLYLYTPVVVDVHPRFPQQGPPIHPHFCNAIPGSQGEDWITTYDYESIVVGILGFKRIAYVACDYVL